MKNMTHNSIPALTLLVVGLFMTGCGNDPVNPKNTDQQNQTQYDCSVKKTCSQMTDCDEAVYYYTTCHEAQLDRDKDGVPCENVCGSN